MRNILMSYLPRERAAVDPGYRHADGHRAVRPRRGEHVELVPLAAEHADDLVAAAAGRPVELRLHRGPGDAEHMRRLHRPPARPARRRRRRAVRPAPASPTAGSSAAPASSSCAGGAAGAEPDEVEIGGTWLAADAQRSADQHRGQAAPADPRLRRLARRAGGPRHRRPQRAQPRAPSSASAPASRASCATTARRWSRARPAGPGTRRCSPITDDDWPAVRAGLLSACDHVPSAPDDGHA